MKAQTDEYELGEDITEAVTSRKKEGTAVLLVRLSVNEIKELEAVSRETGRTLSQVVREARKSHLQSSRLILQPTVTITCGAAGGFTSSTGAPAMEGRATQVKNLGDVGKVRVLA